MQTYKTEPMKIRDVGGGLIPCHSKLLQPTHSFHFPAKAESSSKASYRQQPLQYKIFNYFT